MSNYKAAEEGCIKVLRREVEILNGLEALLEFNDIIIFSISVELVCDKKKLEACGLS